MEDLSRLVQTISHVVHDLAEQAAKTAAHADRTAGALEALRLGLATVIQTHPDRAALQSAWDTAVLAVADTMTDLTKPASPSFDEGLRQGLAMLSAHIRSAP